MVMTPLALCILSHLGSFKLSDGGFIKLYPRGSSKITIAKKITLIKTIFRIFNKIFGKFFIFLSL